MISHDEPLKNCSRSLISKGRYLIWDGPNQRSLSAILILYPGCENGLREAFLNQLTRTIFQRVHE